MEWIDKIGSFKQIDVRGIQGNFFQGIKKQAMQVPAGNGLEITKETKLSDLLARYAKAKYNRPAELSAVVNSALDSSNESDESEASSK